jgi:glycosyltransferase involved in cell wall biosynthesis
MPPTPLVSVVIPTCNRREALARCLESIVAQKYCNFEILVVDDCSYDGTPGFLTNFAAAHENVAFRSERNDRNCGANASRNRAIRAAQGEFVAFLDSDCVAQPDWLEKLIGAFESERVAAVTGRVTMPPPSNIYELTLKGTSRVHGAGAAPRLVAGNMCIRRSLLLQHPLDEDLKYGCDEEGIYLRLKAAGFQQVVVPDAIVRHEHFFDRRSFLRQAFRGGGAAAWLVYKYHLPTRLDLLPFIMAYLTLSLALIDARLLAVPALFFLLAFAAVIYNELCRKGKTLVETVCCLPMLFIYYHLRLSGYVSKAIQLRFSRHGLKRVRLSQEPNRTSE